MLNIKFLDWFNPRILCLTNYNETIQFTLKNVYTKTTSSHFFKSITEQCFLLLSFCPMLDQSQPLAMVCGVYIPPWNVLRQTFTLSFIHSFNHSFILESIRKLVLLKTTNFKNYLSVKMVWTIIWANAVLNDQHFSYFRTV